MKNIKKWIFLPALIAVFLAFDLLISCVMQPFFLRSGRFYLNDFEIVQRDHPEEIWDKVFYGSSLVISGFREAECSAGYINLGLSYGVITDLWEMLDKGYLHVGSELVIGLGLLTLYDDFETNPNYQWHRTWYQPYSYFERDRLKQLLEETVGDVFHMPDKFSTYDYVGQQKYVATGTLTPEEIMEHRMAEHYLPYLSLTEADFQDNLKALENIRVYCQENGIRLRLIWMPENPVITEPDAATLRAYALSKEFAEKTGVEFHDMRSALPAECFYDVGHLNDELGAHVFTEVIDPWLNKQAD